MLNPEKEWLENLKPEDEVAVISTQYGATRKTLTRVTKITKTQIQTNHGRFYKKNGVMVGTTNSFRHVLIIKPTQEIKNELKFNYLKKKIQNWLENQEWLENQDSHRTLPLLETLQNTIDAYYLGEKK